MRVKLLLLNASFLFSVTSVVNADLGDTCYSTCDWTSWEPWSQCTVTCGGTGTRTKQRYLCCPEDATFEVCANNCGHPMDGTSHTESCTATCFNGGTLYPGGNGCACLEKYEGHCCEQEKPLRKEPGGTEQCSELCDWSPWEPWSSCSVSCGGGGEQERLRYLCCLEEYGGFQNCAQQCSKDTNEQIESRRCGESCLRGGILKSTGLGCDCLDRSFGNCCEQLLPGCTPFPTDVIFVLDSSASQTEEQFQEQLKFVIKFVENVNISAEEFQVAIVTFSTKARVEVEFSQSTSVATLRQLIGNIKFRTGATFTDKGLLAAMEVARNSERRKGMVTLTYAFVLTDGMSNKRTDTRLAATQLKNAYVHVVAIGIGHEVSHEELQDIASPGDTHSPSYVFSVGDFSALDTLLKQLVHVTCEDCSAVSHLSDILFLVDESNQMTEAEFQLSVDVMTSIVQSTNEIGEPGGPRFALVQLSSTLDTIIQFSNEQMQNKNDLQVRLQTLYRRQTDACEIDKDCSPINITSAVASVYETVFMKDGRQNSRKFFVVLSSGRFGNSNSVKEEMSDFHKSTDLRLFVIGPGLDVDMESLQLLAKEANYVYVTLDNDDLSKLDILQSEFTYNVCTKT